VVEETWETVLPTNLIALQTIGALVNKEGLPCGDGCEDLLTSQFTVSEGMLEHGTGS
jgi:hypothetical protein